MTEAAPTTAAATQQQQSSMLELESLRGTPEYAAVFDMEVWRAEQRQRFHSSLESERQAMKKELEAQYAAKDAERVAVLDEFRSELEAMALGFKRSGEALQQRIVALEKREAAFESRRLDAAREHEGILLAAETRARQVREDMARHADTLQSKLNEKERMVQDTLQRLHFTTSEYETLQNHLTRVQSEEVSRAESIAKANAQIAELSSHLEAARREVADANRLRDEATADAAELKNACAHYKRQLKQLASQHNEMLRQMSEDRLRHVDMERKRLSEEIAEAKRKEKENTAPSHHVDAAGKSYNAKQLHPAGVEPSKQWLMQRVAEHQKGPDRGPGPMDGAAPPSDIAALRHLIQDLVQSTEESEKEQVRRQKEQKKERRLRREREAKSRSGMEKGQPFVPVVDRAEVVHMFENRAPDGLSSRRDPSVDHHDRHPDSHTVEDKEENVSVSSLSDGEGHIRRSLEEAQAKQRMTAQGEGATEDQSPHDLHGDDADGKGLPASAAVAVVDHSIDLDDSLPCVTPPKEPRHDDSEVPALSSIPPYIPSVEIAHAGSKYDSPTQQQQPPFRHNDSDDQVSRSSLPSTSTTAAGSSSTTTHTSRSMNSSEAERADFRSFVLRLQSNRDKLLESGVYTAEDNLIRDMERKIATYEKLLAK